MNLLIGLTGLARSGKDTVASYLCGNHDFVQYSFAFPIKQAMKVMFGVDPLIDDDLKEVNISWIGRSPRQLYQLLGTEFGRDRVHPDIWVRNLEHRLAKDHLPDMGDSVVITDCRFENEAAWIRESGGEIWHIKRDIKKKVNAHRSEDGIKVHESDFVITNNTSLEALYMQINYLLKPSGQVTVPL